MRNRSTSTLDGTFYRPRSTATAGLTQSHGSIQEALRMYFQPIKSDDPQLDFYTMYKRETMEYDTEYMQKHNEDLNTTLIFVRCCVPLTLHGVYEVLRLVCFPLSAPHSSSTSSPSSSQIPANGPKPTYVQSSSASIDPFLQTKSLPLLQRGVVPPKRSSQHRTSCMRVS